MTELGFAVHLEYDPTTPPDRCIFRCQRSERPTVNVSPLVATATGDIKHRFVGSANVLNAGAVHVEGVAHKQCLEVFASLVAGEAVSVPTPA